MAARLGARRMREVAKAMLMLSIALCLVLPFWLIATLFFGGWALYGSAYVVDGFATPESTHASSGHAREQA